jgi:hypothetical protein
MVEAIPSLQQVALQARLAHAAITLARQVWIRKRLLCAPLMHVPPGTKVDPANEIGGCYRYAVSRRESAVDLVLKFSV